MARENVYLGKSVEDTGKKGLDNLREVRDIAENIVEDCVSGRISYKTAMSRMNLLELIVSRDKDFYGAKKSKARAIVDRYRARLQEECGED